MKKEELFTKETVNYFLQWVAKAEGEFLVIQDDIVVGTVSLRKDTVAPYAIRPSWSLKFLANQVGTFYTFSPLDQLSGDIEFTPYTLNGNHREIMENAQTAKGVVFI